MKLWKHHSAQPIADRLNEVAIERGEPSSLATAGVCRRSGTSRSSSRSGWRIATFTTRWTRFVEATDWVVWQLTGRLVRASCTAGYKACWSAHDGLPSPAYFEAAYPGFPDPAEKLGTSFAPPGPAGGTLRPEVAARLGLSPDVAVAVGNVDSFVSVPGAGVQLPGVFVMVVGTSICDLVIDRREIQMAGITGVVEDGILPGFFGYEAGQAAVGRHVRLVRESPVRLRPRSFRWELVRGSSGRRRPSRPGASGSSPSTGGTATGRSSATPTCRGSSPASRSRPRAAEIYRALLESVAFGTRRIVENFVENGIALTEVVACGGIAERSSLMMQLLADVTGLPVTSPTRRQIPARGAALFGALAAGSARGGFDDIETAVTRAQPATSPALRGLDRPSGDVRRVYSVFRGLHDELGLEHAEWLAPFEAHPAGRRGDPHMTSGGRRPPGRRGSEGGSATTTRERPRIGMLGIMQELYDEMIPRITEHQAEFAAQSCVPRLAPAAEVVFTRPARNRDDIEEIVKDLVGRDLDGIMIVMLTYGPAMRTLRALEENPLPLLLANIQPEPVVDRGRGRWTTSRTTRESTGPRTSRMRCCVPGCRIRSSPTSGGHRSSSPPSSPGREPRRR